MRYNRIKTIQEGNTWRVRQTKVRKFLTNNFDLDLVVCQGPAEKMLSNYDRATLD